MDSGALLRRVLEGTREFSRLLATDVHELDGVTAAVVPECPERSVMNCVSYDSAAQLAAVLDDLAAIYDDADVVAWTVWVPPGDRETAALLAGAGHQLDASPEAMGMELAEAAVPPTLADWTREADLEAVAAINDAAYGYDGSFARALAGKPTEPMTAYAASVDGCMASCLVTFPSDGDCHVTLVATLSEARGHGLAGALLARALADARERGLETTSLVATKAGRPLYERLGYRPVGAVEMWERRRG